uniref:Uncharacterized protein n=1 Tax=Anguilla anguilla TaxID=7936 RepID=A0A0E9XGM9_ANGAN
MTEPLSKLHQRNSCRNDEKQIRCWSQ